jgi:hypothetical protein
MLLCRSTDIISCSYSQLQKGTCPDDDRCESATTIDNFPFIVASSNTLYSAEGYGSPATSCNSVDGLAKTVWYELEGDGSCLSASVVGEGEGFEPLLALYDGDDCDLISCEGQSSYGYGYGYGGTRGLLSWRTQNGTAYVLAVTVRAAFMLRLPRTILDLQLLNSFVVPFCRVPGFRRLSRCTRE